MKTLATIALVLQLTGCFDASISVSFKTPTAESCGETVATGRNPAQESRYQELMARKNVSTGLMPEKESRLQILLKKKEASKAK